MSQTEKPVLQVNVSGGRTSASRQSGTDQPGVAEQQRADPVTDFPLGAIENGRAFAERLEGDYSFQCEAGQLTDCVDWQEFRRCFEYLAEWAITTRAQLADLKRSESANWIQHPDITDVPDVVLTDAGLALKRSQINASDGKQKGQGRGNE